MTYGDDANKVAYSYDNLGRTTAKTLTVGSRAYETGYSYLPGSNGSGNTTALISVLSQPGEAFSYTYDDVGNISSVTRNGVTTTYLYDKLGQLIRVNDPEDTADGTTWVYEYDLGGNILNKKRYAYTTGELGRVLETIAYEYDTVWKDKLVKYDGNAITYDAIGNPLTDGTWTYTWEKGRQLKQMTKSGTTATFLYNADGLRIRKTVGSTVTNYTLHGKNIVHMTQGGNNLHFFYDASNKPAIVEFNGTKYAYVHNLQGDIVAILDSNKNVVVSYAYDAWGRPISCSGNMKDDLGKLNPFRYRGYVYDEETGLYYLRSRYYASEVCRFINSDITIGKNRLGFHNLYSYCVNDPTNAIDYQGTEPFDLFETELDAVFDFADLYSNSKVEVSALICRYGDKYFYGTPSQGDEKNSTIPPVDSRLVNIVTPVTYVHTHPDGVKDTIPTIPSEQDIYAVCAGAYTRSYLVVFDGSVLKMDRESDIPTLPVVATNDEKFGVLLNTKVYALRGPVHKVLGDKGLGYIYYTRESSKVYSKLK